MNLNFQPIQLVCCKTATIAKKYLFIIFLLFAAVAAQAQDSSFTISGKVTSDSSLPIASVSVVEKGTTNATVTNEEGAFKINVASGNAVLVFSSVGFENKEVNVENKPQLDVVLKRSEGKLDEVVVTALGIKKASRSLAYNVQTLGNKDITRVNDANLASALVGKVAGATVNASASGVGGSVRMVLRGTKSIKGNNNALYVVDGIPMPNLFSAQQSDVFGGSGDKGEGIANINPDDIESISVLSGASAAALYGFEAQNGVILVTTKKGAVGKTRVDFSTGLTLASPFLLPELQTSYGSLPPGKDGKPNIASWGEKLDKQSSYSANDFFQTGTTLNNAISVSTGTEKSQTFFSAASLNAKGVIQNNTYNRYNFTIRNTTNLIAEKLDMDVSAMYLKDKRQNPPGQGQYNNPLIGVYLFPPADVDNPDYMLTNYEKYNPERKFNTQNWAYSDLGIQAQNPYWITNKEFFNTDRSRFMGTFALKYTFNEHLNLAGRVKYDEANDESRTRLYASTIEFLTNQSANGLYRYGTSYNKQSYADLMLNYNRKINDFDLKVVLGSSLKHDANSSVSVGGPLVTIPDYFHISNVAKDRVEPQNTITQRQENQAIFGSADIGYKNLLFLTLTARNDWNSALAYTSTGSIFYPSVGISGILSDMVKLPSFISYAKIRGSYSEVGNPPARYSSNPRPTFNPAQFSTVTSAPFNLKPERTQSTEAGIDLRFIQNKVNLSFTYYNTNTINQIFAVDIPLGGLYNQYSINAGKINNHGIELTLGHNVNISELQWSSNLTFSLNKNKIIELLPIQVNPYTGQMDGQDTLRLGGASTYAQWLVTGKSSGDIYVNTVLKTNPDGSLVTVKGGEDAAFPNALVPVKIDSAVLVGNSNPKYNIGFSNGFSYKGFNLNFVLTARVGGQVISGTQALLDYYGASKASADARDAGGVTVRGTTFSDPRAYYQTAVAQGGGGLAGIAFSEYVYSATNVRLSEASLGYRFQKPIFNNKIKGVEFSVIGRNLLMIYNKAPFDPELAASTSTFFQGYDFFNQPSQRYIGAKLNLTF